MNKSVSSRDESVFDQLRGLHSQLRKGHPDLGRLAVAVYDPDNERLRTFIHSTDTANPLMLYEARFESVPALGEIAWLHTDRTIDDLRELPEPISEHTRRLLEVGFRSSYTHGIFSGDQLCGFLFLDSRRPGYFSSEVVEDLALAIQNASLLVRHHLLMVQLLRSAVRMARELSRARDWETGNHLQRMARYSKLIAATLGPAFGLDDETVEYLFLFAPLHDLGKVGVPDHILLKEGPLSEEETRSMRSHVVTGSRIVDTLLDDSALTDLPHTDMLHNIVRHHHEAIDGTGYPDRLSGEGIPREARVVTVADVFDALTTVRPYKEAWSVDRAFDFLREHAGSTFDVDCVTALCTNRAEVVEAMQRFQDAEPLPVSEELEAAGIRN